MTRHEHTAGADAARVVVALDCSSASIRALRQGARIATALGRRMAVVTVWRRPNPLGGASDGLLDRGAAGIVAGVEAMQAAVIDIVFGASPPPGLDRMVLEGAVVPTLLAESAGAEMLVLGSRGRGGFAGLLLGSVSAACAAHAACPVLVCHSDSAAAEAQQASAELSAPDGSEGEIVVGVNGRRASVGALRQGAQFAESLRLPLMAICASDDPGAPDLEPAAVLSNASQQVFGSAPPHWFHSSVRSGKPSAVLGRASEHARMLVIGHSERSGRTASQASVSSAIALQAACPVVIFHASFPSAARTFDGRSR